MGSGGTDMTNNDDSPIVIEPNQSEEEDIIRCIREGLDDIANGRCRPVKDVFRDLALKYGLNDSIDISDSE